GALAGGLHRCISAKYQRRRGNRGSVMADSGPVVQTAVVGETAKAASAGTDVSPMTTELGLCVQAALTTFGAFAGFSLVRFITAPTPWITTLEEHDSWWLFAAFSALVLRYIMGSAVHLTQTYVLDTSISTNPGVGAVLLFAKDIAFLV